MEFVAFVACVAFVVFMALVEPVSPVQEPCLLKRNQRLRNLVVILCLSVIRGRSML